MHKPFTINRPLALVLALTLFHAAIAPGTLAQTNPAAATPSRTSTNNPIAQIRDEGLNRSQVMQTLSYLTDVIGPRLTGSPNLKRANEWTRGTVANHCGYKVA